MSKFPFTKTLSPGEQRCTRKFSKYEISILKNVWILDKKYLTLLDTNRTFVAELETFLSWLTPESYPETYDDVYQDAEGVSYYLSYIFCSGQYLEDMAEVFPRTKLLFQLRTNAANGFRHCIVRPWYDRMKMEELEALGIKDLTAKQKVTD